MTSEPDGISVHATAPQFVAPNNTDAIDLPFRLPRRVTSLVAQSVGVRERRLPRRSCRSVGPYGCIYLTQDGVHSLNGTITFDDSICVQICPGSPCPQVYLRRWITSSTWCWGDSYSSGEGAPPFEDETNYPAATSNRRFC